jgi:hypothetical protein
MWWQTELPNYKKNSAVECYFNNSSIRWSLELWLILQAYHQSILERLIHNVLMIQLVLGSKLLFSGQQTGPFFWGDPTKKLGPGGLVDMDTFSQTLIYLQCCVKVLFDHIHRKYLVKTINPIGHLIVDAKSRMWFLRYVILSVRSDLMSDRIYCFYWVRNTSIRWNHHPSRKLDHFSGTFSLRPN